MRSSLNRRLIYPACFFDNLCSTCGSTSGTYFASKNQVACVCGFSPESYPSVGHFLLTVLPSSIVGETVRPDSGQCATLAM
ncbi:hypothetical protein CEXT_114761 [Caerostris extrusa]|uniref:Uncharacterized protein n=1 Tax=Caerostris extrusa TaxID=172846 RepID=A0AAV4X7N3_CAEEX|nr:hypothetical protein CEXT_114761 [Caerostris extrusa]